MLLSYSLSPVTVPKVFAKKYSVSMKVKKSFIIFHFFFFKTDGKPIVSPFFRPPPGQEYEKINAIKGRLLIEG